MSNAVVAAERWLYATLAADATLAALVGTRIYGHVVPPLATRPFVYFTMPGAADNLLTVDATRIWSSFVYAVRIVDRVGSYVALESGASAIEDALHKASGTNVSGSIVGAVAETPFAMFEIDKDGHELRHLGSLFRLYVQ